MRLRAQLAEAMEALPRRERAQNFMVAGYAGVVVGDSGWGFRWVAEAPKRSAPNTKRREYLIRKARSVAIAAGWGRRKKARA